MGHSAKHRLPWARPPPAGATAFSPAGRRSRRPPHRAQTTHSALSPRRPRMMGARKTSLCSVFHHQHHCALLRAAAVSGETLKVQHLPLQGPHIPGRFPRKLPGPRDAREDAAPGPLAESSLAPTPQKPSNGIGRRTPQEATAAAGRSITQTLRLRKQPANSARQFFLPPNPGGGPRSRSVTSLAHRPQEPILRGSVSPERTIAQIKQKPCGRPCPLPLEIKPLHFESAGGGGRLHNQYLGDGFKRGRGTGTKQSSQPLWTSSGWAFPGFRPILYAWPRARNSCT